MPAPSAAAPPPRPLLLGDQLSTIDAMPQIRYWLDETGARGIDDVASADDTLPWAPRRADQQDRLDDKALWIQFDASLESPTRWFLQVGTAATDRIQLHYRDVQGAWVVQQAGDRVPVTAWPVPGRVPTFSLAPDGQRIVRYWLRVEHSRFNFAAPLLLVPEPTLLAQRDREQFLLGAYFGLAALIAIAALVNGIAYRDRCFAAYAVYVALLATGQLARLGIGAQHLWPEALDWNEAAAFVLPILSTTAALWFVKVATEPARFSMALDLAVWALIAASLAALGVDAVVGTRASLGVVLAFTVLSVAAMAMLIGTAWFAAKDRNAALLALGFLPVIVMAAFPIARAAGLIPSSLLTRYGLLFGALLEMPILYYALSVRSVRRREGDVRASALSHSDALTGLANRGTLVQRLQSTLQRATGQKQQCAVLAVRIANLPAIQQEFGDDALEKSLVVAASHLRRVATDIDLAARAGDNAFALLVESPATAEVALSRAQQLVASGLRHADALPPGLTLKFHVAVALLPRAEPDAEADAQASLDWVIDGLLLIPPDARKLIRPLNFGTASSAD